MSKPTKRPLTGFLETGSVTFWVISRDGWQIVCRPHVVTGRVRVSTGPWVPPDLLARMVPIEGDLEDLACR